MRRLAILVCSAAFLLAPAFSLAQGMPVPKNATPLVMPPAPLSLPGVFDGWEESGHPQEFTEAAQVDPAHAAALTEYGFKRGIQAAYKRDGETLSLRAMRFGDVTGAYGAYSYYRQNGWPKVDIGSGAASNGNQVLFWKGTTVVDAKFSHIGPMSAGELREIANRMPVPTGNGALLPPVLAFLPQRSLEAQTTHYALGTASYAGSGGVLPPGLVGFDREAETVSADYSLPSGTATLTIINYPEPQMAAAQEQKIRDYIKAGSKAQPPFPKPLQNSDQASLEVRRSGPLVVVVSGDAIPDESHRLIESVYYSANLTAIPVPGKSQITMTGELLMGIAGLVMIGGGAAILIGFSLGGGRVLYRKLRGKPLSTIYDEEFIHLDLSEKWEEPLTGTSDPHPKG